MGKDNAAADAALQKTLARVKAIRNHLDTKPRTGRLAGKVAVVTGCNSLTGIGRATARLFAHEGVKHLYCSDFADDNLADLKTTLNKLYPDVKVDTIQADAADEPSIQALIERVVKEEGQLDIFFANAGIAPFHPLEHTEAADVMEVLRVNTLSCALALRHASPAMKLTNASKSQSGGSIIMTASVAGLRSGAGFFDYSAAKAGVISLAQTGAWALTGTDIRVNAICPGLIETGMTEAVFEMARSRGTEARIGQLNPLRRYGVAEEIANAVIFLASDEASYVNGIALPVCGGLSTSHPVVPGKSF